jgi:hypothetical protein
MTARIGRRVGEKFEDEGREIPEVAGGTHLGKYTSVSMILICILTSK